MVRVTGRWMLRAAFGVLALAFACIPEAQGPLCPEGLSLCAGRCVDVMQSEDHCGACDAACAEGEACVAARCDRCAPGLTDCGEGCVSLDVAPEHCGACGQACAPTQRCEAGQCQDCAASALCDGRCVDVERDAMHCGGCGTACDGGRRCDGGSCVAACVDAPLDAPPTEVTCAAWEATWVHHAATPGTDDAQVTAFGVHGAVYLAGETTSSLAPFGCETRPATGDDIWVASLEPSGAVRWCRRMGGSGNQQVFDMKALPSGGVLLAGRYRNGLEHGTDVLCSGNGDEHAFTLELKPDGTPGARYCDGRPVASQGHALAVAEDAAYLLGFDAAGATVGTNNPISIWALRVPIEEGVSEVCNPLSQCARWTADGSVTNAGDIVLRDDAVNGPRVVITSGYTKDGADGSPFPTTLMPGDPTPDMAPGAVLMVGLDADLEQPLYAAFRTDLDCVDSAMQQVRNCAVGRAVLVRGEKVVVLVDYRRSFTDGVELPPPASRDVGLFSLGGADFELQGGAARISSVRSEVGVDLVDAGEAFFVVSEVQGEALVLPDGNEIQKTTDTGLLVIALDDDLKVPDDAPFLLLDGPGAERGGRADYRQGLLVLPGVTNGPSLRIGEQTLYQVNGDDAFAAAFAY